VRADENQQDGDVVHVVRLQELEDEHPEAVRRIAGRWEQGLRGLLGLTGATGLIGAPLAVGRLDPATQATVGILLLLVLLFGGGGLLLTMAAAYGSTRQNEQAESLIDLQQRERASADRARRQLLWGRGLAVSAVILFAGAVAVGWLPDGDAAPDLLVDTEQDIRYCGPALDAPDHMVALDTEGEGRVEIPAADIAALDVIDACDD
jgi:hypothetical protein